MRKVSIVELLLISEGRCRKESWEKYAHVGGIGVDHFDLNLTNVPAAVTCPPIASVPLPWAHECARGSCVRGITLEGSVTEQRGERGGGRGGERGGRGRREREG